jgi:hypothetical protein
MIQELGESDSASRPGPRGLLTFEQETAEMPNEPFRMKRY